MKTRILLFLFTLTIASPLFTNAQSNQTPLDGKKYKIELKKDGKIESEETLIFDTGSMKTPEREKLGFKEGTTYVKVTEDYYTWSCTVSNDKVGAMAWQGTVKGDKIEGTCIWRKIGHEPPVKYTFAGTEVK